MTNQELHSFASPPLLPNWLFALLGSFRISRYKAPRQLSASLSAPQVRLVICGFSFGSLAPLRPAITRENLGKRVSSCLRYAVLLLLGYVIFKSLSVNGLAVILGLLVSTAAVLASSTLEIDSKRAAETA